MTVSSIRTDGGGDYTSIQAWEDACPSDITASGTNEDWVGELENEEFLNGDGRCTFGGIVTDATHQLILRPSTGSGFAENSTPGTTPLRYNGALGAAIRNTTNYQNVLSFGNGSSVRCLLQGLMVYQDATRGSTVYSNTHTQPVTVDGCVIQSRSNNEELLRLYRDSGDRSRVENSAFISSGSGLTFRGRNFDVYFSTVYRTSTGDVCRGDYGTINFEDCLYLGAAGWQTTTQNHTILNGVTDLSSWESSTATDSVLNAVGSDEIVADTGIASTVDLTAKSGGSSDGGGVPISGITTDIFGQARDASAPTVGAFEINPVVAGFKAYWALGSNQLIQASMP